LTLAEFEKLRDQEGDEFGAIVATSGGFDPIHPGHISCIIESKKFGDTLVVIVNGDNFLVNKKGKAFQDLATRAYIVSAIRGVDYVVTFEIENDPTVAVALRSIRPHIFTKGGDRVIGKSFDETEMSACIDYSIKVIDGVGLSKNWSSSDFLRKWGEFLKGAQPQ